MTIDALLKLIPPTTFEGLAMETKVDFQVKKLTGETVFKLILFSMLNSEKLSLRVMESFLSSAKFKTFSEQDKLEAKYNSIRDRICSINPVYFEKLFHTIFSTYNKLLREEKALEKADSTYISISAKLIDIGMFTCKEHFERKQLKYSVNLKGSLPCEVKVYSSQAYIAEDLALAGLIHSTKTTKGSVVVFDRGLKSRKTFDNFSKENRLFIGRCRTDVKMNVISKLKISKRPPTSTVKIKSDQIGYLMKERNKNTEHRFRIISAEIIETGEPISFVTNLLDQDAYWISELYRQRWEIEVFFKFIKQHLNAKHLVSRNINGIYVMLYMTMILAILISAYKKLNKLSGFKIAKLKFEIDLDNTTTREIVILCGGDPDKAKHLWNSS